MSNPADPGSSRSIERMTAGMARLRDDAWCDFHDRYFDRIHRYLIAIVRDEALAGDCVQQTFLRIVRHIRVFRDEEVFWGWLACLARCAATDALRRRQRHWALIEKLDHFADDSRSIGHNGTWDLTSLVEECLGRLAKADRRMLERKYFEAWTCAEIAAENGTSVKAVESRLVRLRVSLRECLSRLGYPPSAGRMTAGKRERE